MLRMNGSPSTPITTAYKTSVQTSYKRQQQDFKDRCDEFKRECEFQEERAEKLKMELDHMRELNETLEDKCRALKLELEQLSFVNKNYLDIQSERDKLKRKLDKTTAELDKKCLYISRVNFENDQMANQILQLNDEKATIMSHFNQTMLKLQDEIYMHDNTRKKLNELENSCYNSDMRWQQRFDQLNNERSEQICNWQARLQEKDQALQNHMELALQVQSNYQSKIKELMDALEQAKKNDKFNDDKCGEVTVNKNDVISAANINSELLNSIGSMELMSLSNLIDEFNLNSTLSGQHNNTSVVNNCENNNSSLWSLDTALGMHESDNNNLFTTMNFGTMANEKDVHKLALHSFEDESIDNDEFYQRTSAWRRLISSAGPVTRGGILITLMAVAGAAAFLTLRTQVLASMMR